MAVTPFAETECLLAVLNDDEQNATRIAEAMTRGEQAEFLHHLRRTASIVEAATPEVL